MPRNPVCQLCGRRGARHPAYRVDVHILLVDGVPVAVQATGREAWVHQSCIEESDVDG